jgi:hypothetical protein
MRLLVLPGPCATRLQKQLPGSFIVLTSKNIEAYSDQIMICVIKHIPQVRADDILILPSFQHWCDCAKERQCARLKHLHYAIMAQLVNLRVKPIIIAAANECNFGATASYLSDRVARACGATCDLSVTTQ